MDVPVTMGIASIQTVVLKCHFPLKRIQGFLEKWLIPGLGKEMYKMSVKYEMCSNP